MTIASTRTLVEIATLFQVYGVCTDCRRMEQLPLAELMDTYGPTFTLIEVRRRVKCRKCGRLTGQIRIIYVGEGGKTGRFHYQI